MRWDRVRYQIFRWSHVGLSAERQMLLAISLRWFIWIDGEGGVV